MVTIMDIDTGHLCDFHPRPTLTNNGNYRHCVWYPERYEKCTTYVTGRSCDEQLCARHWKIYCEEKRERVEENGIGEWDHCLSACANRLADSLGMEYRQRKKINSRNIFEILGVSGDPKLFHLSGQRIDRKKFEIDHIMRFRTVFGFVEYRVKWKDGSMTWVNRDAFTDKMCPLSFLEDSLLRGQDTSTSETDDDSDPRPGRRTHPTLIISDSDAESDDIPIAIARKRKLTEMMAGSE